jgi:hypothetical protein
VKRPPKRRGAPRLTKADREWLVSALQLAIGIEKHDQLTVARKNYRVEGAGPVHFDTWEDLLTFAERVGGIPQVSFAAARIAAWRELLDRLGK